jgi:hypothetical protein
MLDYRLFLDDIREPVGSDWLIARSYDDAVKIIKTLGIPRNISLDHDLGTDKTGYDLAKFIIEYDQDHNEIDNTFVFKVHSANPVGAKNIECILNNYIKFKNEKLPEV